MRVLFSPELPEGDEWIEVRENISRELPHIFVSYLDEPAEVIVQLDAMLCGAAFDRNGTKLAEINYDVSYPHKATYTYVGSSKKKPLDT